MLSYQSRLLFRWIQYFRNFQAGSALISFGVQGDILVHGRGSRTVRDDKVSDAISYVNISTLRQEMNGVEVRRVKENRRLS